MDFTLTVEQMKFQYFNKIFYCFSYYYFFFLLFFLIAVLGVNYKGVILRAFEQFRLKSCIDFKPRAAESLSYISVESRDGYSMVPVSNQQYL